jgi:hypothetical protein
MAAEGAGGWRLLTDRCPCDRTRPVVMGAGIPADAADKRLWIDRRPGPQVAGAPAPVAIA